MSDNDNLVTDPAAHIASLFGAVAADEFSSALDEHKAGLLSWAGHLAGLTDTQLAEDLPLCAGQQVAGQPPAHPLQVHGVPSRVRAPGQR